MRKILPILMLLSMLAGCRDRQMIPDDDLKAIISEVYLADCYLREMRSQYDRDTMTILAPVLERYGYTMDQMKHTLYVMSQRKTSSLPRIVDMAVEDYAARLRRYRAGYDISLRWDTLSNRMATLELMLDSLKARDTSDFAKTRFEMPIYRTGIYTITMSYKIDSADRNKNYLIKYTLSDTMGRSPKNNGSVWLGRMGRKSLSTSDIKIDADKYNRMSVDFLAVAAGRLINQPIVDIDTMSVTYRPPIEKARQMNYQRYFGLFNQDTVKFKVYETEKDSSALRPPFRVPYAVSGHKSRP
ncbi:MAG: hypothetical protein K2F53_02035 [Rikenellaceae bacterium]|nr:hypothetical protein [Rikenellaceae bacterium]MDE7133989.1 hypothetical protein [Rikenellaceae bacterium]MDE7356477.1 hypothetical protein [Rikenellaceae bacterium]